VTTTLSRDAHEAILQQVAEEGDPQLLLPPLDELPVRGDIPASWARILATPNAHEHVLSELWDPVRAMMPRTLDALEKNLSGVALLLTASRPPSLLYLFGLESSFYAHRGFAPTTTLPDPGVRLSADLLPFYRLHDGWVDFFSGDFGLTPSAQWRRIGAGDDGTGGFLAVFSSGSAALGFDVDEDGGKAYTLWPGDEEVEEVPDFWAALDEWLAEQLEEIGTE
jgi:hypothetical protein